jgi:DNA-binding response OmpR family regulator
MEIGDGVQMVADGLEGRRILIVEDEEMIAMLLEDYLQDFGCEVAGHATTVAAAISLIGEAGKLDAALLDMNLRGELVTPVAAKLAAANIPFCFMTGLGAGAATGFPDAPTIGKPFDQAQLKAALTRLFSKADAASAP